MCSSAAYFKRDSGEELLLSDVMFFKPQGDGFRLVGLLGDEKIVEHARLLEIDFERNRILIGPAAE